MLRLQLQNWCAYHSDYALSGTSEIPALLDEERAFDVSFLPALRRRRLSRLSRLCLRLANQVSPAFQGYCVFGSQHGELVTTITLLEQICQGELPSPAGFSASVHNTAAGLHSINTGNEQPYTSVAAGRDTLPMCLLEAWSILTNRLAEQVLVVFADDAVPALYQSFSEQDAAAYGLAAVVNLAEGGKQIRIDADYRGAREEKMQGMRELISLLVRGDATANMLWHGESHNWMWAVNG
mgnify:FL=1